jgi:hypothetical protein
MEPLIRNIFNTARWVAVSGIRDTGRPDAIFNAPFVHKLAGERGQQTANTIEFALDKIVESDVQQSNLHNTPYTDDSTT